MIWQGRDFSFELNRTLTMAIVNVTPDSFSDGGQYFRPEEAVRRALNAAAEGADLIDLGGESTRPGATPLGWDEEWSRLEPVFAALRQTKGAERLVLSVDTYHPETAERALAAGAHIVNCVKAESIPGMAALGLRTGAGLVLPCRGEEDFAKIAALLPSVADRSSTSFVIDPMIGFETTREQDLALMGSIRRLAQLAPVLVGVSRKRLVKKLVGVKAHGAGKNLGGSVGAAVWAAMAGAAVVRVHDVKETVQALKVVTALAAAEVPAEGSEGVRA